MGKLYDGSVGKLLPVVYVRGKLAHVGQVFSGLNPINLLAEIVRNTELNPDTMEKGGNSVPLELVMELSMPVVNIGPWGKDFHKYTERVLKDDVFRVTPALVDKMVSDVLG